MSLADLLAEKRLLVCVGTGGVGKTTTSAALALAAARRGRKTLVITIDPAKRLAQSLGLEALDDAERRVDPERLAQAGLTMKGELYAAMLDTQAAFDALVRRITPSPLQAQRILDNRLYRQISTALTGSPEYVAMERLYDLMMAGRYDLVVLDTPPSKNALDFLEAPNRLAGFLDENVVQAFLKGSGKKGAFVSAQAMVYRLLGVLLGEAFIRDLREFFEAFNGLYGGFKQRARAVEELLRADSTAFVLVAAAERGALEDGASFFRRLVEAGLPLRHVVVNRAFHAPVVTGVEWGAAPCGPAEPRLAEAWRRLPSKLARWGEARAASDQAAEARLQAFRTALRAWPFTLRRAPRFEQDIHDLQALAQLADYLEKP